MDSKSLSLLLIEDNADFAETLADYLCEVNMYCEVANNGFSGLAFAQDREFNVILLDLNLPRLNGIEVCKKLRQNGVDTPVIMITSRDKLDDKIEGFGVGTDDYLVKPFEFTELVLRVKNLANRKSGESKLVVVGPLTLNLARRQAKRGKRVLKLTPTGWKILLHLARKSPRVVGYDELECLVWGENPPDSNSLKTHLFNLRRQVQKPFEKPLLQSIRAVGVCLKEEPSNEER
ncbi:response regulator transcription factor [Roseibium sp.]|uniref:response regulator transcription factor n=1 Tax=Roseibium sp. TaxID=1936156 RepID=UPI003B50D6BC